jgi:prefoldin subunit 5
MAYYDKESAEMQQETAQLMIKCAELARENDVLQEQVERLTFRIENLRAALQSIENVDREDEDLCSWWALEALREDNDFVKDTRDER